MRKSSIFLFLILIFSLVQTANAVTITFSDLDLVGAKKILIYNQSGGFIGEFNTTDTVNLNNTDSYIIVFKPSVQEAYFKDPLGRMTEFAKANLPVIMVFMGYIAFVVGMVIIVSRAIK